MKKPSCQCLMLWKSTVWAEWTGSPYWKHAWIGIHYHTHTSTHALTCISVGWAGGPGSWIICNTGSLQTQLYSIQILAAPHPSRPPVESQFCPLCSVLHHLREELVQFGKAWSRDVCGAGEWSTNEWEGLCLGACAHCCPRGHMPASWSALF